MFTPEAIQFDNRPRAPSENPPLGPTPQPPLDIFFTA